MMEREHMVLATKDIGSSDDLYQLIDFLNRTLKDRDIMFGLTRSRTDREKYTVTIYRTDTCD